jgi:hypothetical protein
MFNPIILVIGVGAALFAFASNKKPGATPAAPQPGTGKYDPGMDLDTERAVDVMLATDNNPNELREMAASLRPEFPRAADFLDTKANALSVSPSTPPLVVPPSPPIPIPPSPPVPLTPQPPVFIPPAPPPAIPPSPPIQPMQPPGPPLPKDNRDTVFTPGHIPASIRPFAVTGAATQTNHDIQFALGNFFALNPVVYPDNGDFLDSGFTLRDPTTGFITNNIPVDGVWGPRSQLALWAFQTWSNIARGTKLSIDGLPGPASLGALDEWT